MQKIIFLNILNESLFPSVFDSDNTILFQTNQRSKFLVDKLIGLR